MNNEKIQRKAGDEWMDRLEELSDPEFIKDMVKRMSYVKQGHGGQGPVDYDINRLISMASKGLEALEIIKRSEEAAASNDWWCPVCKESPPGQHVTFEGYHDRCGTFIDHVDEAKKG